MQPGDRVTVTMPRSPSREGEYVEDRGTRCRVLIDGEHVTRIVLRERVKPVLARVVSVNRATRTIVMGEPVKRTEVSTSDAVAAMVARGDGLTMVPAVWREGRTVPKPPKPWRSDAYRAFVRTFPCCCCGRTYDVEAHHHGPHAMGEKGSDATCVPLSRDCHRAFHAHGAFKRIKTREMTDRLACRAQIECLRIWCAQVELDADEVIAKALRAIIEGSQT